jgi:hypothetical protein
LTQVSTYSATCAIAQGADGTWTTTSQYERTVHR